MPLKNCKRCGPSDTDTDHKLGHIVCLGCGAVLEENTIVSDMTFTENAKGGTTADGFSLQQGQARAKARGGQMGRMSQGQDSRTNTLNNGNRRIQELANAPQIRIPERLVSQAQRLFKLAVENNFTKGRRAGNVIAACLYIVCRMNKTAHMLIDFSDALSINVYEIGNTFLDLLPLVAGKDERIPIIDPSLYISRFAARLDFGELTQQVVRDANRIVSRMNRDWMQTGRRPSGICAASLFVASRMHGFNRTMRELILVVKIAEGTLRSRLKEFQATPSGQLTVADFQNIWLEADNDPPAFSKNKKRKHGKENAVEQTNEGDDDLTEEYLNQIIHTEASAFPQKYIDHQLEVDDGNLSDLDNDPEIDVMISVSETEKAFKEEIWLENNADWLARQEQKILRGDVPKTSRRKKPMANASSAYEAARNLLQTKPSLSKKINYEALDNLVKDINYS